MKVELTLTVRKIEATDFNNAKELAHQELSSTLLRRRMLLGLNINNVEDFNKACRVAKEADGTFTVTIP